MFNCCNSSIPVYLDVILGSSCPTASTRLMRLVFQSWALLLEQKISFSLTSISYDPKNDEPYIIGCIEKVFANSRSDFHSPLETFYRCFYASGILTNPSFNYCLGSSFSQTEVNKISACLNDNVYISAIRKYNQLYTLQDPSAEIPKLFINGKIYCGPLEANNVTSEICEQSCSNQELTFLSRKFPSLISPVLDVDAATQTCGTLAFSKNCQSGPKDLFAEFVPIIGLLFLTMTVFTILCLILLKRRYERTRFYRHQRPNMNADNDIDVGIFQFLAFLAAREENLASNNLNHKGEVDKCLGATIIKEMNEQQESCAVCLEPVDKYYDIHCHHIFHTTCLRAWLDNGKSECPVCRAKIIGAPTSLSSNNNENNNNSSSPTESNDVVMVV